MLNYARRFESKIYELSGKLKSTKTFASSEGLRSGRVLLWLVFGAGSSEIWRWSAQTQAPFIGFFLIGACWSTAVLITSRNNVAISCLTLFACLTALEGVSYWVTRSSTYVVRSSAIWTGIVFGLGSYPIANAVTEQREFFRDRLISDAIYELDENGLRRIPKMVQGGPKRVAFFGCSFMFGHGLNDDQTFPFFFLAASQSVFRGFNFAGEGWGPHQSLRELESGFVKRVAGHLDLAIYEGISDHLRRVAGNYAGDPFGPKYIACGGYGACYVGPFFGPAWEKYELWTGRSWTVQVLRSHLWRRSTESDLSLYISVLKDIRERLETDGTRFVVVFWDYDTLGKKVAGILEGDQFEVIRVSRVIPDLFRSPKKYLIFPPIDMHPTAAADQRIANYVWARVASEIDLAHIRKRPLAGWGGVELDLDPGKRTNGGLSINRAERPRLQSP